MLEYLVTLRTRNQPETNEVIIIVHWATLSGATGPICKLVKRPGDPATGHYSRQINKTSSVEKNGP
eukprot:11198004-Lingulodinium_polyedra.AAC.1